MCLGGGVTGVWLMMVAQMKQQQAKVVGNKKWHSQLSDASRP